MGLDIVEFVMGVEEAVGVRIPDTVAANITTPRLLIDYLHGQLPQSRGPRTLGEASRYVATVSPAALKPAGEGWSWDEVAAVVDGQMRHHFAICNYSLDDRFVEHLGLG